MAPSKRKESSIFALLMHLYLFRSLLRQKNRFRCWAIEAKGCLTDLVTIKYLCVSDTWYLYWCIQEVSWYFPILLTKILFKVNYYLKNILQLIPVSDTLSICAKLYNFKNPLWFLFRSQISQFLDNCKSTRLSSCIRAQHCVYIQVQW